MKDAPTNNTRDVLSDEELGEAIDGCEKEQIHIPGSIQPHGYLLVLGDDFSIVKFSQNFEAFLGEHGHSCVGRLITDFVDAEKINDLKETVLEGTLNPIRYSTISLDLGEGNSPIFDAIMHPSGAYWILELEATAGNETVLLGQDFYQQIMEFSVQLQKVQTQSTLYDYVVQKIRSLTGFDRVKLYQFDQNWNGEVVAEDRAPYMTSYLGLRFPAFDIPKQARTLYSKNYLRLIPDIGFKPVNIVPDDLDQEGAPIDLSFSTLRSVSPVHMEYLANMGVGASMSISVMQNGRLWGLIACHHNEVRHLSYQGRMAAELIGHTFSAFLSNLTHYDEETDAGKRQSRIRELRTSISPSRSLIEVLKEKYGLILQSVNADGVIIHIGGKHFAFGLTPEVGFSSRLISWLEANYDGRVFSSDSIARDTGLPVQGQTMASGVVAIPVTSTMTDYVIWFRQEQSEEIHWAGKPGKKIAEGAAGHRLTPRRSFALWKENVRGFSKPWTSEDLEAANHIAKMLLDKKYEDSLKQADHDLQSILDNSSAYIYIIDIEGRLLRMNDSFLQVLELDYQNIVGKPIGEFFSAEVADIIRTQNKQVLTAQKSISFEMDFALDGKEFHLITVTFPLYDANQDVHSLCSISTDISTLRQTQYELERSNKELERVAFVASHDLQEPVRMMANFSKLLSEEYRDKKLDDTAQDYLAFTLRSAERMRILIQDLLQYSRVGHEEGELEVLDADKELQLVIEQFALSGESSDASIAVEGVFPKVIMKSEHFECVMHNLLGNALKFRAPDRKPVIAITSKENSGAWQFSVSDNGIGIQTEYLDKIFDIFQRLHSRDEYEGTGIGLALCSRLIDRYHGKIWVESEPGQGSTFHFILPKFQKAEQEA